MRELSITFGKPLNRQHVHLIAYYYYYYLNMLCALLDHGSCKENEIAL